MSDILASVRAKYPGVYDDIPDDELTLKLGDKYPQYRDALPKYQPLAEARAQTGWDERLKEADAVVRPLLGLNGKPAGSLDALAPDMSAGDPFEAEKQKRLAAEEERRNRPQLRAAPTMAEDMAARVKSGAGPMGDAEREAIHAQNELDRLKESMGQQGMSNEEFIAENPDIAERHGIRTDRLAAPRMTATEGAALVGNQTAGAALAGAQNAAADLVDFFTSGPGLLTLMGQGVAGEAANAGNPALAATMHNLMTRGFAVDMARSLPDQFAQVYDAMKRGDVMEATRGTLNAALTLSVMKAGADTFKKVPPIIYGDLLNQKAGAMPPPGPEGAKWDDKLGTWVKPLAETPNSKLQTPEQLQEPSTSQTTPVAPEQPEGITVKGEDIEFTPGTAIDKANEPNESETANEPATAAESGQHAPAAPVVDVRKPAGAGEGTAQPGETAPASGEQGAGRTESGGPVQEQAPDERGRSEGGSGQDDTQPTGRTSDAGQPPAAGGVAGAAEDREQPVAPTRALPTADEAKQKGFSLSAIAIAREYHVNQDILDAGKFQNGNELTPAVRAALEDTQRSLERLFHKATADAPELPAKPEAKKEKQPEPPAGPISEPKPEEPRELEQPETPAPSTELNHVLPDQQDWIPTGDKAKVRANLEAINLLKKLEAENRNPTPAEKEVLAKYTGWGGLKQVFDEGKAAYRERPPYNDVQRKEFENWEKQWGKLYDEVQSTLTPEEWDRAARSILNAHYSSRKVINAVWKAAQWLGFRGGKTLETSAGIGHFVGLTPEAIRRRTKWTAVELDSVSGRILSKLYPEARVHMMGFQDAKIPRNSQDMVIGNFPFAQSGHEYEGHTLSLHNFFFARSLDLVRPGGIVAAITSDSTLDGSGTSREARQLFAKEADFLGAIRLPNNAFKENAGTEVTTDILFFRKRDATPFRQGEDFIRTVPAKTYKGEPIELNEYYVKHPEMMLGRMSLEGTMYREGQKALIPTPGADLEKQLDEAVQKLPKDVMSNPEPSETGGQGAFYTPKDIVAGKVGTLTLVDGKVYQVQEGGALEQPDWAGDKKKVEQFKRYADMRGTTQGIIGKMLDPSGTEQEVAGLRKQLNQQYDDYVKRHGPLNERASWYLDDDVDYPLLLSLEDGVTTMEQGPGGRMRRVTQWSKGKIFTERTIFPRVPPERVDTVPDALQVSQNFRGRVDPEYIAQLTRKPQAQVEEELRSSGAAFQNPKSGQWEGRSQYLSGFVRDKLREAEAATKDDPSYSPNVEALKKVQPEDIPIQSIGVRLGATWVPPKVIARFLREQLGVDARVYFTPETGNWHVAVDGGRHSDRNTTTYGIHGWTGSDMVEAALNLKAPVVKKLEPRTGEDGRTYSAEVKDGPRTLEAEAKQDALKREYQRWVKNTPDIGDQLAKIYNEQFNGVVAPKFEGPTWDYYPGASTAVKLYDHQKAVVSRNLQNSTLLAHAVGTGKTYVLCTTAMEQRRLGLARKPMIVVQNSTIEQFAASFKKLYPSARLLVPNAKMRDAINRNKTMSRIATGDWDAVVVPQSFINLLPDDAVRETKYINDRLDELKDAIIEARATEGKKSPKAADLQKAVERMENRLTELADRRTDNVLTFEQLGVDALSVDEAHEYKKLEFTTKMDNIKGLDKGASQRAWSMHMKTRWIQEKNQGRNVVFATGTPVSNTIAEAWTMMRYLRPDLLKAYGIESFDAFAATFAETATQLEMTAGGNWKTVTRLARYTNGPELIAAWRALADVVTAEEVNLPGLPALKGGKVQGHSIAQTPQLAGYIAYLRSELERFAAMSGREKRENTHIPLVTFTNARKASLDMRMIDPTLEDQPGSKLNAAADEIARIHRATPVKGTQLAFADLFQDDPDNPRFNAYDELKKKLVERGVPEHEIVIMTDKIKDARREALFEKVNNGEVRVLIGSSGRMGVGVNVQRRLIGLHHLDAPHRPLDIEQREGRILRQGNQNPEVEIHSYGVENSLDAALYQKLAMKQKFINQILRGQIMGRSFEDAANDQSLSFEEQMAAFSGDPRAMQKVGLEQQVRNLEALQQGHESEMSRAHKRIEDLSTRQMPYAQSQLAAAEKLKQTVTQQFDDTKELTLEAKGQPAVKGRKEVIEALDKLFEKLKADAIEGAKKREKFSEPARTPAFERTLNGAEFLFRGEVPISYDGKAHPENVRVTYSFANEAGAATGGAGFFTSLTSALERIGREPERWQRQLDGNNRDLTELTGFVKQPFEREKELQDARQKLDALNAELTAEGKAEPKPEEPRPEGTDDEDEGTASHELMSAKGFVKDFQRAQSLTAPQTVSTDARYVGNLIRQLNAELANVMERASVALAKARRRFDRTRVPDNYTYDPTLPLPTNYAFIDAYETGNTAALSPADQVLAAELHRQNNEMVARVRALGTGALNRIITNYFPHLWEDPTKAQAVIANILRKRPLEGSKGFLKERTHALFQEGLEAGLKPVHDNPIDLWLLKMREVERFIMANKFKDELKSMGLLKFVHAFKQVPPGFRKVDDRAFDVYAPPFVKVKEAFDAGRRDALYEVLNDLGIPHERKVKLRGRGVWGREKDVPGRPGTESIETKFGGDDSMLMHELGHALHNRYPDFEEALLGPMKQRGQVNAYTMRGKTVPPALQRTAALTTEARALADLRFEGQTPSPNFKNYVRKTEEKIANIVEAYMYAPERMQSVAPTIKGALDSFIAAHPELAKIQKVKPTLRIDEAEALAPVNGVVKLGSWYLPEAAANVVNNYLSPGLNPHEWYRTLREVSNLLNGVQLGVSGFHLGFTSVDAAVSRNALGIKELVAGKPLSALGRFVSSPVAPFTNLRQGARVRQEVLKPGSTDAATAEIVKALEAGGGRIAQDHYWRSEFTRRMLRAWNEGTASGYLAALGRAPLAALEQLARPMMEYIVPRQKLGVFADMAKRELLRLGPGADPGQVREAMAKAWDSVDNRMGQMVYDNLFYNRMVKDVALLSFRAFGWQLGKYREGLGGAADYGKAARALATGQRAEFTDRMAYMIALPVTVGILGGIMHYLYTGTRPQGRDFFQPKTGEKDSNGNDVRLNLPSYAKDALAHAHDIAHGKVDSFAHALNPMGAFAFDLLENKDFYNVRIRNPDDPLWKQGTDVAMFAAKQFVPFSVSGAMKLREDDAPVRKQLLPFFGVTPVPTRLTMTPAQEMASEIMSQQMPKAAMTKEQADRSKLIKEILKDVKSGQPERMQKAGAAFAQGVQSQQITPNSALVMIDKMRFNPLQFQVHALESAELAMRVWRVANAEERQQIGPILAAKIGNSRVLTEAQKVQYFKEMGFQARN